MLIHVCMYVGCTSLLIMLHIDTVLNAVLVNVSYARFLKLELSRESRVIPGTRNNSVLATANLGLSSE